MTAKNRIKYLFIACIGILALVAMADALGFFNEKPYTEVTHGSHIHYVPHDRKSDVPIHNFPQQEPGPDQEITPTGQLVRSGAAER